MNQCFNKIFFLFTFIFVVLNFSFSASLPNENKRDSLQNELLKVAELPEADEFKKATLLYKIAKHSTTSDSCIPLITDSKSFAKRHNYDALYLKSLLLEIEYYRKIGNHKTAIDLALEGIKIAESIKANDFLLKFHSLLPYSYSVLGDYTNQYESTLKLQQLAEKAADTLYIVLAHNAKATFYWHINELDKAIEENIKAFELANQLSSFKKSSIILLNRSVYYYANKKYTEALLVLKKAEKIALTKKDSSHINQNIGLTYCLMDSLSLAAKYLDKTFEYYKNTNEEQRIRSYYQYRGFIYYKLGDYKKASSFFNLLIRNKDLNISTKSEVYKFKYKIAKHYGQLDAALLYYEKHTLLSDSILKINNIAELKNREWKQHVLIKEFENNRLIKKIASEEKISRLSFIITALILLALILLFVVYFKNKKIVSIRHKNKIELKNKELFLLKTQRINRSEKIEELYKNIEELKVILKNKQIDSPQISKSILAISKKIDFDTEKDWEEFRIYFEKLNTNFFSLLREKYPKITKNDEKLCAFIKMNMDSKQISRILNVLPTTVVQQRNRLRKKMNLPPNSDIRAYLNFD